MQNAPPLPVEQNRQEFLDYARRNDIPPAAPFFSAYPLLGAQDILLLEGKPSTRPVTVPQADVRFLSIAPAH